MPSILNVNLYHSPYIHNLTKTVITVCRIASQEMTSLPALDSLFVATTRSDGPHSAFTCSTLSFLTGLSTLEVFTGALSSEQGQRSIETLTSLRHLHLFSVRHPVTLLNCLQRLESLVNPFAVLHGEVALAVLGLPCLTRLEVDSICSTLVPPACSLTDVTIHGTDGVALMARLPLAKLTLHDVDETCVPGQPFLAQHLVVVGFEASPLGFLPMFLGYFPMLRALTLRAKYVSIGAHLNSYNISLVEKGLALVLAALPPCCAHLHLECLNGVTDIAAQVLPSQAPQLTHLWLEGLPRITDTGVDFLRMTVAGSRALRALQPVRPKLAHLHIAGCKNTTWFQH